MRLGAELAFGNVRLFERRGAVLDALLDNPAQADVDHLQHGLCRLAGIARVDRIGDLGVLPDALGHDA